SVSRRADKYGACTTKSVPSTHSRPMTHQRFSANTEDLPSLIASTRSIGSVGGPVISIGLEPTYSVPSGARPIVVGKMTSGTWAASSIDQPEATAGKPFCTESAAWPDVKQPTKISKNAI